ncbi:MAG: biotin--[Eubacterium sp.]|nr:biotin--[acetyl-CoA-carboxylase] ligase [Eubacterium sp.]
MQLQTDLIKEMLAGKGARQDFRICCRRETDSTNDWARREAGEGAPDGTVFLADHQSAGKGRRGRRWESPEGTSVSMSILLRTELPADRISMLTLVMGLAAAEAVREVCGIDAEIKWPNDVVWQGKKLCGILTELGPGAEWVVIGIGLNVNVEAFPEELADMASSMRLACGHSVSREAVTAEVIRHFADDYQMFLEAGDLRPLRSRYEALLANRGARVRVLDPAEPYEGVAGGINDRGELQVVRSDTQETVSVFAGEVSVRGIYGYV